MSTAATRIRFALMAFLVAASMAVAVLGSPVAAGAEAVALCRGMEPTIIGTPGDDVIDGTDGPDVIQGLAGDDVINGMRGDDVICGDEGADTLYGNRGADELYGGPGSDELFGGIGPDLLSGKKGNDRLFGSDGHDTILGGSGRDNLVGGKGNDTLEGNRGQDKLRGDNASAPAGSDILRGGMGNDNLWAQWWYGDGDQSGVVTGGPDFDTCADGATQKACEWDGNSSNPEVWRPLVAEVFARWGLDEQTCSSVGGPTHCVGPQVDNAVDILACESSGDPLAVNPSSGTTGLFQHQQGVLWTDRVDRVRDHPEIEPHFPVNADPFDPEHNIIMAALLVWESKETQLLGDGVNNAGALGGISPEVYPEFNFDHYTAKGSGYKNWGEGPEPWAHWVGCGSPNRVDLYDPTWIHPWADTQWP